VFQGQARHFADDGFGELLGLGGQHASRDVRHVGLSGGHEEEDIRSRTGHQAER